MKGKKENSFLEGSVFGALIRFAVPVLGALILQAAYGAVDLLVVGRFGDAASISAVGTGSSFMAMVTFVITSLAMGATVTIGQHIGEKKPKEAGDTVGTTIVLFAVLGIVLTALLEVFVGQIVGILQVPEESVAKTILYIRICSGGILVIIAYNVISGILRGVGNANLPFIFVGIACVFNILGDLLLVGVLHMDVAGAAIATSIWIFFHGAVPDIWPGTAKTPAGGRADRSAGGDGTDLFFGGQFDHQPDGPDAVGGVWRGAKTGLFYHAGAVLGDAECLRVRGAEYRRGKEAQGDERIYNGHGDGDRGGCGHVLHRLLLRTPVVLAVYERRGSHCAERGVSAGFFGGLYPDLYPIFQYRVLQWLRQEHSGDAPGGHIGVFYPYPGLDLHVQASGGIPGAGGAGDADHHGVWDHLLYDLFCVGQAERKINLDC